MRTTVKPALVALTAATLLASLMASAFGRTFSFTNKNIRAVWAPVTFSEPFGFFSARCKVTIEGSLHETTAAKVLETLIGYITRAIVSHPCTRRRRLGVERNRRRTNRHHQPSLAHTLPRFHRHTT